MANWNKIDSRGKVSDRRSSGGVFMAGGIGSVILLMGVTYLMGGNPLEVLVQSDPSVIQQSLSGENNTQYEGADEYEVFVSTVLGSTDDFWSQEFTQQNGQYSKPELVLFRDATQSSCGGAQSYVGPHYCPLDKTIYLDETFFEQLSTRLGTQGGDVAEAYVIAHEVGHHVQNSNGLLNENTKDNQQSVNVELQADCFAGLWASSLKGTGVFESDTEIQEAIDTAAAVGDDNIQQRTSGEVSPESWTHGSSEARVAAFTKGFETGNYSACIE